MENNLTSVVVLDITYGGYGILRSLAPYNIPLIGLYSDASMPEVKTQICKKKLKFDDDTLLSKLTSLPELQSERPVLMLTTDAHVTFYLENRELLEPFYLIDMPDKSTIDLLLNKQRFWDFAIDNNIIIPKTLDIRKGNDLQKIAENSSFPVILKPILKDPRWFRAKLGKAVQVRYADDFVRICELALSYCDDILMQEWIVGNDSNVEFSLGYFDDEGDSIEVFTGYKLRQFPVATGSTATASIIENKWIENETKKIFKNLKLKGFASMEFKRHERDGRYYAIEPTVGRVNQQEYVATLHGVNIPLAAYNKMTGSKILGKSSQKKRIIYIDERVELASAFVHFIRNLMTLTEWWRSLRGYRAYRFWTSKDPLVFISLFPKLVEEAWLKIFSIINKRFVR